MFMECLSHMGTLHVSTSGHNMLVVLMMLQSTFINMIVHVNKTLLSSLHHMLVLTTTVSLVLNPVAPHCLFIMTHCEMDSSVVVVRLPAAHTPTCCSSSRHSMRPPLRTLNRGCVKAKLIQLTLHWNSLNCLFNKVYTQGQILPSYMLCITLCVTV